MNEFIYKKSIPIYLGKLYIIIADDFLAAAKKLKIQLAPEYNEYMGIALRKSTKGAGEYCLFIEAKRDWDTSVIAHESLHIVHYIMEDRGIIPSVSNDEAQCYLLGWVVTTVENAKDSMRKKLNKLTV